MALGFGRRSTAAGAESFILEDMGATATAPPSIEEIRKRLDLDEMGIGFMLERERLKLRYIDARTIEVYSDDGYSYKIALPQKQARPAPHP